MKKLHFWAWGFVIVGGIVLIASSVWFNRYANPSEYFLYLGVAVFLFVFAGFCEALKTVLGEQKKIRESQLEIQRWITEQERKKGE